MDFQVQRDEAAGAAARARETSKISCKPLRDLFEAWMADGVSRKDGNAELRRTFEKDVLRTIGSKPVREVNDTHVLEVLRM